MAHWKYVRTWWRWNIWSFGFDTDPFLGRPTITLYVGPATIKFCDYGKDTPF